jgi:hypothetical protein
MNAPVVAVITAAMKVMMVAATIAAVTLAPVTATR